MGRRLFPAIEGPSGFDITTGQILPIKEYKRRQEARQRFAEKVEIKTQKGLEFIGIKEPKIKGAIGAAISFPVREPVKTRVLLVTGAALPKVIGGITSYATGISGGLGTLTQATIGAGGVMLGAKWAKDIEIEYKAAETELAKGRVLGTAAAEVALLGGVRTKPAVTFKRPLPKITKQMEAEL
ncbi:unnamed protein product, partial [marine sediment metagenome]